MDVDRKVFVVADDLTGATDAAAQLSGNGIATVVWVDWERLDLAADRGSEGVVVNSESRHVAPREAARRVSLLVRAGRSAGFEFIFKKTDSTLRGNIGAELEAAAEATGAEVLPFIPASPRLGRTTVRGVQYVHGKPLAETEYARDPLQPMRESSVADILRLQVECAVFSGDAPVPTGAYEEEQAGCLRYGREGIVVFDASTMEDLSRIALKLKEAGLLKVAAGPAAFLEAAVEALGYGRRCEPGSFKRSITGRVLVLNGSLNPVSFEQLKHPELAAVRRAVIPRHILFGSEEEQVSWARSVTGDRAEGPLLLCSSSAATGVAQADAPIPGSENAACKVSRACGVITRESLKVDWNAFLVIGGDTLAGAAHACGWDRLEALGEASPGIALVREPRSGLLVATKPGGFGAPDAIARLLT